MGRKWLVISNIIGLLLFFLCGATASAKEENGDALLSVILGILLSSEEQNSVVFAADGQLVNFQVPGINLSSVTSCVESQDLPSGLVLQVNSNQTGCEIVGIASQIFSPTLITVIAINNFGNQVSSVLSVSVDSASVISGRVTYDRVPVSISVGLDFANTRQEPVRGATVELISNSGVLQTTITDSDGRYSFEVNSTASRRVRVKAEAIQVSSTGANYNVVVVDNTSSDALYALTEAQASSVLVNPVRNLNAGSGWNIVTNSYTGTRAAAPFAILDSIFDAMTAVIDVDPDVVLPPLTVNWSVNNSISAPLLGESIDQARAAGRIGSSFYIQNEFSDINAGELFLLGAIDSDSDEFDRHVVIHEWGHYFEDRLSRSDSIGGSHGVGNLLDLRLAFSEGFGNALSAIVTDDPLYADTFTFFNQIFTFNFDVEENDVENPGWYSEASVQSILYDLYDNVNDGEDRLSLGFESIYNTMTGSGHADTDAFTSIFSFIASLRENQNFQTSNAIEDIVEAQSIEGFLLTQFGSIFENNIGGLSTLNFRPIYETASLTPDNPGLTFADIDSERVCTATNFIESDGQTNKLFNSTFLQVDIPAAGDYLITVIQDDFFTDYEETLPSALIFRNGEFISGASSIDGATVVFQVSLSEPGTHIIEVFDNNIESNVGFTGEACFDVGVVIQ